MRDEQHQTDGYITPENCDLEAFKALIARTTKPSDVPMASALSVSFSVSLRCSLARIRNMEYGTCATDNYKLHQPLQAAQAQCGCSVAVP